MTTIAILGLGAMGSRMARRLLGAGCEVHVWNRSPAPVAALAAEGARPGATPRAAVEGASLVISMVTDDAAARSVWLDPAVGAAAGLTSGAIAVESSTVSPDWIDELRQGLAARGVPLLDAPVAGSRPQAEAGQLIFMVGGPGEALETARPLLAPLASAVHHIGPSGAGARLKLAVNSLFAAQLASVAELLGFLRRSGIEGMQAAEFLAAFPVTSPAAAGAARLMASGSLAPLFTIDLVAKDLAYALAEAGRLGAALPLTQQTLAAFARAQAAGHGAANVSGLARLYA